MTKLEKMKIDTAKFHRSNSVDSGMNEMTAMYYGVLYGFDAADAHYRPIVEALIEALEFYANGGNFSTDVWEHPELGYFTGKTARQALESVRGRL